MIKIPLCIILSYLSFICGFAQGIRDTAYTPRTLTLDEVNLISAYYNQDGNNSAVTGGIGTEKLTDFANNLELKLSRTDFRQRMHSFNFTIGVDAYTSASSDKIDPNTISSASSRDVRVYPSLDWKVTNFEKRRSFDVIGSFSTEFDYTSFGGGFGFTKISKDENRELGIKVSAFLDTWKVIYPIELRGPGQPASEPRNSFNASVSLAQVINQRLQMALIIEPAYQQGLLGTKYQRVYFNDHSVRTENLPDTRWKIATGLRANCFIGDYVVLRSFYRYYMDQWNLSGHTFILEAPVKLGSSFITFSPFYRYYIQNGISYFAPYGVHLPGDLYYTSDYDLSDLSSQAVGAGLRFMPVNGVFRIRYWNILELRYEHYMRSTGLVSDILTLGLKFKPNLPLKKMIRRS